MLNPYWANQIKFKHTRPNDTECAITLQQTSGISDQWGRTSQISITTEVCGHGKRETQSIKGIFDFTCAKKEK